MKISIGQAETLVHAHDEMCKLKNIANRFRELQDVKEGTFIDE